jgi:hypothetical protein
MSAAPPARYWIVPRHTPDWQRLSDDFRRDGCCNERDFVPEVPPPGFPEDLTARIDLWNQAFKVDFFTCRARIAEIARSSWTAVSGAGLLQDRASLQRAVQEPPELGRRFLFVDDDDWFAPDLPARLEPGLASRAAIVRWAAPVFNGEWQVRLQPRFAPRTLVRLYLYARSRPVPEAIYRRLVDLLPQEPACPLTPADHILYTNNYAVTERYLDLFNDLDCVADHSDASKLAIVSRLRIQSLPRLVLSATNKHPCSAGVIGRIGIGTGRSQRLRHFVEGYVRRGRKCVTPASLAWAKQLVDETLSVFEAAL